MKTIAVLLLFGIALAGENPSPQALKQIEALLREKNSRSKAQQKLDSHLHYYLKMARGQAIAEGIASLPRVRTAVTTDSKGALLVDIRATVTTAMLEGLQKLGVEVISYEAEHGGVVRAAVPALLLERVAEMAEVKFVGRAEEPGTSKGRLRLPFSIARTRSQGDFAHQANLARELGFDGTGIKIGVLSDGIDSLATRQASGDLPMSVTVLNIPTGRGFFAQRGKGDEGTATLEIVHDLAPGAQLFFATGLGGPARMAGNIIGLRNLGCDIIVDDVTYFDEGAFQDGPIARAVNTVVNQGALYFSSAGNSGNQASATGGVWEGDFVSSGVNLPVVGAGSVHSFFGSTSNTVAAGANGGTSPLTLKWSDPLGAAGNDYDLFVLDARLLNVIAVSSNIQNGAQDPYERVGTPAIGVQVVVVRTAGAGSALRLDANGMGLGISTTGASVGHNAAASAFTVAAVDVANAGASGFTGGSTVLVENFSSDGLRRMFYNPDGTSITPGNVLFNTNGGTALRKPDFTAADGVATLGPLYNPFFGTSAAAPHAAAIAALVRSANPVLTRQQVGTVLRSTALDIGPRGIDVTSGAGIVMALSAVKAVVPAYIESPAPGSTLSFSSAKFTWNVVLLASEYWLSVGTPAQPGKYFSAPVGLSTSQAVALPVPYDGNDVVVQLWTKCNGNWGRRDYLYRRNSF